MTATQWLDAYGFWCAAYRARISNDACRTYQRRAAKIVGAACWRCERSDLEYADRPKTIVHGALFESKYGRCSQCGVKIGPKEKRCAKHKHH